MQYFFVKVLMVPFFYSVKFWPFNYFFISMYMFTSDLKHKIVLPCPTYCSKFSDYFFWQTFLYSKNIKFSFFTLRAQVRDPLETYFSFNGGLSHWFSNQYEAIKMLVRLKN